nr:hypothetical protein Iba_chr14dCG6430 [Ipomoea batatas]
MSWLKTAKLKPQPSSQISLPSRLTLTTPSRHSHTHAVRHRRLRPPPSTRLATAAATTHAVCHVGRTTRLATGNQRVYVFLAGPRITLLASARCLFSWK